MTQEKTAYVAAPADADGNYSYYLVAGFRAVRILRDEHGYMQGAEVADPDSPGVLKSQLTLVTRVEKNGADVEEITKAQFLEFFQRYALKKSAAVFDGPLNR